eukprot:4392108-Amphidinium_carterae.2
MEKSPDQPVLQNHTMLSAPSSNMARRNRPSQKQRLNRALASEGLGRSRSRGREHGRQRPAHLSLSGPSLSEPARR